MNIGRRGSEDGELKGKDVGKWKGDGWKGKERWGREERGRRKKGRKEDEKNRRRV